ncbi:hypothetical protein AGDE_01845 [Angomonas deanei]|uniref:RNA uridylyltransferase n=1 Tax=Angomonas deanei TaxID=59799 RepID=A0A7G2CCR8_9TRYP|nr:hypothetical protein AGDE_01845 [Angomonas deanei]CAD2217618.1 hypothetical protein, conserved [Angomonas deanei]|eukprot:EPY42078.1 hypothetical protein AGDE_01845 [Angomonas deanei]
MSVVNQTTTIGSDKREDGGFRGHHRRPRRGDGEKWPERKQYTLCDQCGNIEEYPHHQDCQHRETSLLLDSFAELTRHNKEAEALTDAEALQLGLFVLDCVIEGDAGEEMFNVMCKCQAQLHRLLSEAMDERPSVFLFGSCVSMGCWDGHGDGDFAVVVPEMLSTGARAREARKKNADTFFEYNEETVNSLLTALSEGGEKSLICGVGRKMRNGGFLEEELDVVVHTRIPVVRRKRLVDQRYEPRQSNEPFVLEFFFENDLQHRDFLRTTLPRLVETYGCREMEEKTRCKLSVALDDSTSAFRLFSRSEWGGIRKQWLPGGRLPEIFYVDFDISSRIYGVRNSWFMRQYLIQDEVFRVGNLFVKTWSKARSVNNSRQGYLTSYAMTELWIHYLLQAGEATFVEPSSVGAYPFAFPDDGAVRAAVVHCCLQGGGRCTGAPVGSVNQRIFSLLRPHLRLGPRGRQSAAQPPGGGGTPHTRRDRVDRR